MRDYTKIKAWEKADDLTVSIYEVTKSFPKEEIYALTSQIRRAAYSVPANIAEGSARESMKDYLHFLYIARGSLVEMRCFVHLAGRLEYIAPDKRDELLSQADEALRTLAGLIKAVESEAGIISRAAAKLTSLVMLSLSSLSLWSKV
jgi:four helix bundle protein